MCKVTIIKTHESLLSNKQLSSVLKENRSINVNFSNRQAKYRLIASRQTQLLIGASFPCFLHQHAVRQSLSNEWLLQRISAREIEAANSSCGEHLKARTHLKHDVINDHSTVCAITVTFPIKYWVFNCCKSF